MAPSIRRAGDRAGPRLRQISLILPAWPDGWGVPLWAVAARLWAVRAALAVAGCTIDLMVVEVVRGDIVTMEVDAVVNAANRTLLGGGGVDGAIHRAAGPRLLAACLPLRGCPVGDAKPTPGFRLPARWVIHTVGPVWHGADRGEPEQLASCYRRCLEVADGLGARTLAFPAISTGVFGYPPDRAAAVAVATLRGTVTSVEVSYLVAFDERAEEMLRRAAEGAG